MNVISGLLNKLQCVYENVLQLLEDKRYPFARCVLQIFEELVGQCRKQLVRWYV